MTAPTPPECDPERVETVARALFSADDAAVKGAPWESPALDDDWHRAKYRRLAAAAIAADPSPAACGDLSPSINFGGDSDAERLMCDLPLNHGGSHQHDNGDGLPPTRWIATDPSPAEEAVKRVRERAWNEGYDARRRGEQQRDNPYRAALASPAPAPQGESVCIHGHAEDDAHVCGEPR